MQPNMKTFVGGTIWLSGAGPWGNGDAEYSGPINSYTEIETVQLSAWERVGVVTNVQATASFDGYPGMCIAFAVANGVEVGSTDFGELKPGDYPDFLWAGSCAPGCSVGSQNFDFTGAAVELALPSLDLPLSGSDQGADQIVEAFTEFVGHDELWRERNDGPKLGTFHRSVELSGMKLKPCLFT